MRSVSWTYDRCVRLVVALSEREHETFVLCKSEEVLTIAPKSLPAKPIELMNDALEADKAYEPSGPLGVPNSRAKEGMLCRPEKLVLS